MVTAGGATSSDDRLRLVETVELRTSDFMATGSRFQSPAGSALDGLANLSSIASPVSAGMVIEDFAVEDGGDAAPVRDDSPVDGEGPL